MNHLCGRLRWGIGPALFSLALVAIASAPALGRPALLPEATWFNQPGVASPPEGNQPAPEAETATVEVVQIEATGSGSPKELDKEIENLRATLEQYAYKRFSQLKREKKSSPVGETMRFHLPRKHELEVVAEVADEDRLRLKVTVLEGDRSLVHTVVKVKQGSTFLLRTPVETDGGGALFLALTVPKES